MNSFLLKAFKAQLLLGLAVLLFTCNADDASTLKSPVQAVATIFESQNGLVRANLYLISTTDPNNHVFVDDATNVELRMPNGDKVVLDSKGSGRYANDSDQDSNLVYEVNQTYMFSFDLDSDAAGNVKGGKFIAVVDSPADEDEDFDYYDEPIAPGDNSSFTYAPSNLKGIITISTKTGEKEKVIYQNFDFSKPTFSGDKWATLFSKGRGSLSVDVYEEETTYYIEFCAVAHSVGFSDALSAELGVASGFLVGRCVNYSLFLGGA